MKPRIHESLRVAQKVATHIKVTEAQRSMCVLIPYVNGRELGLALRIYGKNRVSIICFAENRNSDHIVVYVGEAGERFDFDTNVPSTRAYRARKFFDCGEHEKAGRYVTSEARRLFLK